MSATPQRLQIRSTRLLFTYPQCPAPKNIVADWINNVVVNHFGTTVEYMVYCNELHEDGHTHSHLAVFTKEKLNINKSNMGLFDLLYEASRYHPNIQAMKAPSKGIDYVKKHGDFEERGKCPVKIRMTSRDKNIAFLNSNWKELVENGDVPLNQLKNWLQGLEMYRNELLNERSEKPKKVYWLYGSTGSGKTYVATHGGVEGEVCKDPERKVWKNVIGGGRWFNGYVGQSVALLDDIRKSTFRFEDLLKLTDKETFAVEIKCGHTYWVPDTIYITCPVPPRQLFVTVGEDGERREWDNIDQLCRRITRVYHCYHDDEGYHREVDPDYEDHETN